MISVRAAAFGEYPSRVIASLTRCAVASLIRGLLFRTRDTVDCETLASCAMSQLLGLRRHAAWRLAWRGFLSSRSTRPPDAKTSAYRAPKKELLGRAREPGRE